MYLPLCGTLCLLRALCVTHSLFGSPYESCRNFLFIAAVFSLLMMSRKKVQKSQKNTVKQSATEELRGHRE
jgi:hypothetical protein